MSEIHSGNSPAENVIKGRRVLVVDDNVDITESLLTALELFDFDAKSANDGLKAIALASTFKPDAILLDIGLPGLNGYQVAELIRKEPWGKDIFLIAVTGWGNPKDKALAIAAGFDRHLTKPIEFEELIPILKSPRLP